MGAADFLILQYGDLHCQMLDGLLGTLPMVGQWETRSS
jgi:hypothetical protein